MIIAIDDSGDPGLKLGRGSSDYFCIAAVLFKDDLDAEEASLKIRRLRRDLGWRPLHEFKFRKTSPEIRKQFLNDAKSQNFIVSIITLDKHAIIDNKDFKKNASKLYNAVILQAIKSFGDELKDAHIYIDGESGKDYRRHVKTFFRKELPKGVVKELSYRDSRADNLIQLADMIVGAARRSVERDQDNSYLRIIRKKIYHIAREI